MSTKKYPALSRPSLRGLGLLRDVFDRVLLIIALYALINLATVRFVVDGPSMLPTFETGQFLVVSRVNYLFDTPQRGDIAVFHFPDEPAQDYVKRVIGLPGDIIEFRDTQVYVNGDVLPEPYIQEACNTGMCSDRIFIIGADEYFVLGDNRNRSNDSRDFGTVNRRYFVGEVVLRYWPPHEFALTHQIGVAP